MFTHFLPCRTHSEHRRLDELDMAIQRWLCEEQRSHGKNTGRPFLPSILQRIRGGFHDNAWGARATEFAGGGRFHEKPGAEGMKSTGRNRFKLGEFPIRRHFTREFSTSERETRVVNCYRGSKIPTFCVKFRSQRLRVRVGGRNGGSAGIEGPPEAQAGRSRRGRVDRNTPTKVQKSTQQDHRLL